MATIALYADKMNQMTGLISVAKLAVTDFKTELSSLKSKTLTINKSVCNIDDVISSIQASTQTQEKKIASLNALENNCRTFISEAVRIDREVADLINKRKDEFYNNYSYLKPECEKTWLEKAGDWLASAGEWCKENWKLIVTLITGIVSNVIKMVLKNRLQTAVAIGKTATTIVLNKIMSTAKAVKTITEGAENLANDYNKRPSLDQVATNAAINMQVDTQADGNERGTNFYSFAGINFQSVIYIGDSGSVVPMAVEAFIAAIASACVPFFKYEGNLHTHPKAYHTIAPNLNCGFSGGGFRDNLLPGVRYLAAPNGVLYKSINFGQNTIVSTNLQVSNTCYTFDPTNYPNGVPQTIYPNH